jgi:hypothetical protein
MAAAAADMIRIRVKTMGNGDHDVEIARNATVLQLKAMLSERMADSPVDRQRVIVRGRALADADTLAAAGIADGDTIHCVVRWGAALADRRSTRVLGCPDHPDPSSASPIPTPLLRRPVDAPPPSSGERGGRWEDQETGTQPPPERPMHPSHHAVTAWRRRGLQPTTPNSPARPPTTPPPFARPARAEPTRLQAGAAGAAGQPLGGGPLQGGALGGLGAVSLRQRNALGPPPPPPLPTPTLTSTHGHER